jgi:hypothetical protein
MDFNIRRELLNDHRFQYVFDIDFWRKVLLGDINFQWRREIQSGASLLQKVLVV